MSHIVLKKWIELQLKIKEERDELDRESLLDILFYWIGEIKDLKDPEIQNLYHEYLEYFEDVTREGLCTTPWYSFQQLIDYDIIKSTELSVERSFIKVRDLLWELLVFKSNKECTYCGDDNLRVVVYKGQKDLFFTCDICGYIVDESGKEKVVNNKLYPAPFDLIELKKIGVSHV